MEENKEKRRRSEDEPYDYDLSSLKVSLCDGYCMTKEGKIEEAIDNAFFECKKKIMEIIKGENK